MNSIEAINRALDGGSVCHVSVLRNINISLSNLGNGHVALSNSRTCHLPCHYLMKTRRLSLNLQNANVAMHVNFNPIHRVDGVNIDLIWPYMASMQQLPIMIAMCLGYLWTVFHIFTGTVYLSLCDSSPIIIGTACAAGPNGSNLAKSPKVA